MVFDEQNTIQLLALDVDLKLSLLAYKSCYFVPAHSPAVYAAHLYIPLSTPELTKEENAQ